MAFTFAEGMRYRMPVMFGPSPGPRQGVDGRRFSSAGATRTTFLATFEADAAALGSLMPPGFDLLAARITVEITRYRALEWLAGRGYSTFGVKVPARFAGEVDKASGPLLLVLWENMADPIITGREELGFAKLYCDLPEERTLGDTIRCEARWDGHCFFALDLSALTDMAPPTPPAADGLLHYRYIPKVGSVGEADSMHAAMTPFGSPAPVTDRYRSAHADARFFTSSWEQLPTLHHIVNALAEIPLGPLVAAGIWEQRGGTDLSEQRALR